METFNLAQFLSNVVVGLRERLADPLEVKEYTADLAAGTGPRWKVERIGNDYFATFKDVSEADTARLQQVKPGNVLKLVGNDKKMTAVSEWDKDTQQFQVENPINLINGISYSLQLCEVKIIKAYPTNDIEINDLPVPAVLVDLFEIVPMSTHDPDYNMASLTGRLGLTLMLTAYVVVGSCEKQANLKIRELALRVATEINQLRRFGIQDLSPAQILSVRNQQHIMQENQTYFAWSVEWSHDVIVGSESTAACPDPSVDAEQVKKVYADFNPPEKVDFEVIYP